MIVEALVNAILNLIYTVLDFVDIPQLQQSIVNDVNATIDNILGWSSNLIDIFLDYNIAIILVGIILIVEVIVEIYFFVLWVLKKIPVVGIE